MHMLITGVLFEYRVYKEEKHLLLFGAQVLKGWLDSISQWECSLA